MAGVLEASEGLVKLHGVGLGCRHPKGPSTEVTGLEVPDAMLAWRKWSLH